MSAKLPKKSKVIIVGGGIVGTSIAYHLTKLGWTDVTLLEQNSLGGGTTWHAAGLVGQLRTTNSMTKINKYSVELYSNLEKETGHHVGWKQVGSLIVGKSKDRMTQLRRTTAMAEIFGVEAHILSPAEAREKWPLIRIDDVLGAAWLPHDGKLIPKEVPIAFAIGAKKLGAEVIEGVRVTGIERRKGQVTGVTTTRGRIRAEYVVLSGGMWTRQLGLDCGVTIPLYPVEHHYVVSEPIPGAFDELPVGRDPDLCIYFRGEGTAVMLGAFQKYTKPWMVDRVPDDFSFKLLDPDWEKYQQPLQGGKWRIPALENAKFTKFVNGPESFTPDNNFILGEAPELRGLFVAAGFNSVGIASAGGAGKYLAEWIIDGQPSIDLWSVDIRRFSPFANNLAFLRERVTEVLGLHYQMAWPNREPETGRGLRKTPLHDRLAAQGASFGVKNGWERPNWFAGPGARPVMDYSFDRPSWFDHHAAEHRGAREKVALFDQTGFSKYVLKGRDAVKVLQRLCGADVDVTVGKVVYTGLFNDRGGFESDLTVIRTGESEYRLTSGTAQTGRDIAWFQRNTRGNEHAEVVDVTNAYGVLGVMGPSSRTLLSRVSDAELSNGAFPFGWCRRIAIGQATVEAVRITYVGELGWELHVPMGQLALVHDVLMEAGKDLGTVNAGHYAINSLRLEKGYSAWGAELSPEDTAFEAGLSAFIAWEKPGGFLGRDALLRQKENGWSRQLFTFVLEDPQPILWGSEPILRDGKICGYTTSASYGHTLGAAIGMGYVKCESRITPDFVRSGRYEINVSGRLHAARACPRSPYDPDRKKILG